jgi:uncharacterized membrane protein
MISWRAGSPELISGGTRGPQRPMALFILGLVLFLGTHSVPMSPSLKATLIARFGERPYKIAFWTLSGVGLALIAIGYARLRGSPQDIQLWAPATWSRDIAYVLMLPAFILFVATFAPSHIGKLVGGHPLLAGVILWAMTHMIANGHLAGVLLFAAFLIWAIVDLISAIQRRAFGPLGSKPGTLQGDIITVGVGCAVYAIILTWGHRLITGIPLTG